MKWPLVKISDFCQTGSGGTPSRKKPEFFEGEIPWIKSGDLRENIVIKASEHISETALKESSAKLVPKGAILLAMYGATVGRMAMLGIDAATNQAVCNIIPNPDKATPKYVYYALLSKVPEFLNNAVGGAQPNISQSIVKDTLIPLPPLEEQKRIATILDKADAIRRKRQQAIQLADDFLRSVFLDMFGDPVTNPKGWEVKKLGDVIKLSSGNGLSAKDMDSAGCYPVYGGNGINGHHSEFMFENPQLVIGRVGVYCGAIHITQPNSWVTDNALYIKEYLTPVNIHYLAQLLDIANLNQYAGRAAQPLVSGSRIYPLKMIFPPIEIQNKFQQIKEKLTSIKLQTNTATELTESTFSSLNQKAFRGEL